MPQAATTKADRPRSCSSQLSLSGPMGSGVELSNFGCVALKAKRFPISIPENPSRRAKPTQRRIVGSSVFASAVDGFNPTIIILSEPEAQTLSRLYR